MRRLIAGLRAGATLCFIAAVAQAASEFPPEYRWQTITTEHFEIHFHQGEDELAQRAATIAERAHTRLVPFLGWEPSRRTHLILTDHVDVSNGNATTFPENRMEIYVSAPGGDPSSAIAYYDDWLNMVITHEYAHILHLDQARGFGGAVRRVFGRQLWLGFPNLWSPPWITEGLATLLESEVTDAGRLKGTFVDMILRTAAIENQFATEAQSSGLSPDWPGGGSRYFYGSKFLSWLAQKHGADKLKQYINEYSGNVVPFRVNATAEDVYGQSLKSLWNEWSAEAQAEYRAQHQRLVAEGLTTRETLTELGYETKYPLLSPDGTRLAYGHDGPFEQATIRVREVASGREVATHTVNNLSSLSWSPDGRSIAFTQMEFIGSFKLISDLYIWTIGEGARRISYNGRLKDPAFTPDGKLIAVENRAGRNRLVEVDRAGGIRVLVDPNYITQFSEPALSHDGSRIAVAEWSRGRINVVLYDRNSGTRLSNLTQSLGQSTSASPRFSPDDRTIWFSSDVTGIPNIYAIDVNGGTPRRLTNVYGAAFYPTSVDGRRFYYSDYSADGFDVAMFDASREYAITPRVVPATLVGARVSSPAMSSPDEGQAGLPVLHQERYSPWSSLLPKWWFPIVSSEGDDLVIGASTSGADVLGFHQYQATVTNDYYSLIYAYDRMYPTFTASAFRFDDDEVVNFVNNGQTVATYGETTNRIAFDVTLPYRRTQWQAYGSVGLIRDHISGDIPSGISQQDIDRAGIFQGTLQGFRVAAVLNTARQYPFSVSRENGITTRIDYENLNESFGSDASFQHIRGDVRGYLTIPWRRAPLGRHVLAARVMAGRNSGDFILQRELSVGGSSIALSGLDTTTFPVRGYSSGTLRGQEAAVGTLEYRFPLYEIERGPSTWPLFFNRILGDVFVDAGRADDRTIASTGAEVAIDFWLGHVLPVRYRAGVAYLLRDPGKGDVQPYIGFDVSF